MMHILVERVRCFHNKNLTNVLEWLWNWAVGEAGRTWSRVLKKLLEEFGWLLKIL